jgi:hypothetical protein
MPVPPLPLQEQDWSATQLKPAPQSMATWHGSEYAGTHMVTVVGVQGVGSGTGGHFVPGAHAGCVDTGQFICCSVKHFMPVAQSASLVQGPGTHDLYSVVTQGPGSTQVLPAAGVAGRPTRQQCTVYATSTGHD